MNGPFSNALARRKTVADLAEERDKALALYSVAHDTLATADGAIEQALLAHLAPYRKSAPRADMATNVFGKIFKKRLAPLSG